VNSKPEVKGEESSVATEEIELTDEDIDQIVGGLDHGWRPDLDDLTDPPRF
jgi:hypothetical protein